MIPIRAQPEPADFNAKVRQRGRDWLLGKGVPPATKLPKGIRLKPCWRRCLDQLHSSYSGICAYLCVFLEFEVGGVTTDHFVAKSGTLSLAYEWDNYRLASSKINSRKGVIATILDPFSISPDTFRLELITGRIFVNPALPGTAKTQAQATIDRLKLDRHGCRAMRVRHFEEYMNKDCAESWLERYSPFVWTEAKRQGLL